MSNRDEDDVELDDEEDELAQDGGNAVAGTSANAAKKKKKKKGKKKAADVKTDAAPVEKPASALASVQSQSQTPVSANRLLSLFDSLAKQGLFEPEKEDKTVLKPTQEYKFWKTQPVVKTEEVVDVDGPIEEDVPVSEVQQAPYKLNDLFEWTSVDVNDEAQLKETYQLLTENYVEDKDAAFRFDYSREFLKWAIQPPGWKKQWHLGVRAKESKKLVAFIAGTPSDLKIHDSDRHIVDINFLCIHKKLRSKRLAPVLIKEITRLVNLEGIFQAAYTAGTALPKPFSVCRYWHRSLNFKKLHEIGFSYLPRDQTMAGMIKRLKLPAEAQVPGTRAMQEKDVPQVKALLAEFLSIRCDVYPNFSSDEVKHWFMPVPEVVYSYVVEDPETGRLTDFYSFYNLPSSILRNEKHNHLKAAYLFYYAPKGMAKDLNRTTAIIRDAMIQAVKNNFDVFNCLDLMGNDRFLEALHFGKGDGQLNYYLFNYRCRAVRNERLGLVLQ
ncbi:hypothetical protein HDU78_009797 [Chytriomyces hyalinus]|nr:hypothetical protein HDU78_009797 [Chytriomyces hyalinus]KAJ3265175.1 hypothetical protein HDU77_006220 [Chytriomyces hyalinus]